LSRIFFPFYFSFGKSENAALSLFLEIEVASSLYLPKKIVSLDFFLFLAWSLLQTSVNF